MNETKTEKLKQRTTTDRVKTSLFDRFRGKRQSGDFLCLEFDSVQMTAIEGSISGNSVKIKKLHRAALPDFSPKDDPEKSAEWLRQELQQAKITAKRVLMSLPRSAVTLKHFEFADAPDHELPDIVLLQTEAQSSLPADQLCVDFLKLPAKQESPGVNVLAATISSSLVSEYQKLVTSAGHELVSIGLRPLAVAELVDRMATHSDSDGACLIFDKTDSEVAISLSWKRRIVASYYCRINASDSDNDNPAIVSAARRMLAANKSWLPDTEIQKMWLVGCADEFDSLRSQLAAEFRCDVDIVDPAKLLTFDNADDRANASSRIAGPIGMLVSQTSAEAGKLNFAAPRKAVVRRDRRIGKMIAVAGLTAVLVLAGWIFMDGEIRRLDRRIQKLTEMEREQFEMLRKGEPILESQRLFDSWIAGRFAWTDELLAFSKYMPAAERAYVTSLQLDAQAESGKGRLKATGYARDRADVIDLNNQLLQADDHYELQPHGIRPSHRDPYYPSRFEVEVRIRQPADHAEPPVPVEPDTQQPPNEIARK